MFLLYKSNHKILSVLAVFQLIEFTYSAITDKMGKPIYDLSKGPKKFEELNVPLVRDFRVGTHFLTAHQMVTSELDRAAKAESIRSYIDYEKVPNINAFSFEETSKSGSQESWDIMKNAKYLLSKIPDIDVEELLKVGKAKTEQFEKNVEDANNVGNYALILNGEGSDVLSSALYVSRLGLPPQKVLVNPVNKDPSFDLREFNLGLEKMQSDDQFGKVTCPEAILADKNAYEQLAEKIEKAVSEKDRPFNVVVYGAGNPILELMEHEKLQKIKDKIFFVSVGTWFWKEIPEEGGRVRWKLGQNALRDPEVEQKISKLGVQRLIVHSGASQVDNFVNLIDSNEAGLQLISNHEVNLHELAAVPGLAAYFSPKSTSEVGRHLGKSMRTAHMHNSGREIHEQELAMLGNDYFKDLGTKLEQEAAMEVLRVARDEFVRQHPQTQFLHLQNQYQEILAFWKTQGAEGLEEACKYLSKYVPKDYDSNITPSDATLRDTAYWAQAKHKFYAEDPHHRKFMIALIARAYKNGDLSIHAHASEVQAVVTANRGGEGRSGSIPFFAIPVKLHGPQEGSTSGNIDLKVDEQGTTLVMLGMDHRKLLWELQAFFSKHNAAAQEST
ncbi:hypothetical protein CROQUDRAFT_716569 [Cronartium quercuum f. sp. fusiforme G11]|uniref:Uncharacterized protein n=1 Tax=Cronartium quercuum f. sp. fusiforme G11 TaxID=708437 RepID=A0A9P6T9Z1_9BASI|nr:hypothetical protein CROQUDRAFT_716569 [Cronartium quercuum f. sp. fusiforme G11]